MKIYWIYYYKYYLKKLKSRIYILFVIILDDKKQMFDLEYLSVAWDNNRIK